MNKLILFWILLALVSCNMPSEKGASTSFQEKDPLSSWNNGENKQAIIDFVNAVTDESNPDFVEPADRIATFDNDGTLWCEKPLYIPIELELAYIKSVYADNPEWKDNKMYSAIANNDLAVLKEYSNAELATNLFAAHAGQKEEDYKAFVYNALSTLQHQKYNRPLKELTYSPMVELVDYLQVNNFNVFIVTGGEITSVRTVSEEIYNIPMENVIGSSVGYKYIVDETGKYIVRQAAINSNNDKQVKPTNIELHIGRKPIFAAGNSDGDYEMMEYTLAGDGPAMAILVHHDDEEREYSYMHGTEKAVEDAENQGWYVISMKKDFKEIFAE